MKEELIEQLREFERDLKALQSQLKGLTGKCVTKNAHRAEAERLATFWVETLRSPLEHRFKLPSDEILAASECAKKLHQLSRPNNLKSSYLTVIQKLLKKFQDRFVLPIQQTAIAIETSADLQKILKLLQDPKESAYLQEAMECAARGCRRAACVMGWCAAINRMQKKIEEIGFARFNATSSQLKSQTSGKFKRWNKEFTVSTRSELQQVFDTDLIVLLEGMGLLDDNQAQRLEVCFLYRNNSAHPGEAPIEEANLIAFFSDIEKFILSNPNFKLATPPPVV